MMVEKRDFKPMVTQKAPTFLSLNYRRLTTMVMGLVLILGCIGIVDADSAAALYRYKNDKGQTVLNSQVPPEYIKKGYEILNKQGRVIEVVPPAPPPEELEARKAAREAARQAEALAKQRAEADQQLKRRYINTRNVISAYQRKIRQLDDLIRLNQGKIFSREELNEQVQSEAAALERRGQPIPDRFINELEENNLRIKEYQNLITETQAEKISTRDEFTDILKRMAKILNESAPELPPDPPLEEKVDEAN